MTTEQKVTRKLSAILSADVKGYSLLMTEDEAHTIKTLKEYRNIMSGIITQHSGRVVDAPGDNLLAEFSSVVNAVQSSVEIQNKLKTRNAELPEDKQLIFRIGINIGDVVQDGDSLYGEGVNIAARIESLAEPGGVCISRGTYDHIRNKLGFGYEYLGEHSVKNIKHPVRVYNILMEPEDAGKLIGKKHQHFQMKWLRLALATVAILAGIIVWQFYYEKSPPIEAASVDNMAFPLPEKPSIAVLAFDNMTGDKEQEYFSDGLSEEIISALSHLPELFVIARNSSFTYKGKPVKVQQISEELGVQYVLEGSVRKSGKKIRITAQLIDALKGHHLWAETYDRNIEDLFVVQDEIAMKILEGLEVKLIGNRLRAPCSKNLKAYLKYLKAISHWFRFTREDNDVAMRLAKEAITLDPGYACAYSLLGGTHWMAVMLGQTKSPKQSLATAKKMVDKAIDLDPSLGGPHGMLAYIYNTMGKYEQAIVKAEEALTISPDGELANSAMGYVLTFQGRSEEAIPFYKKVIRIDPFSTYVLYRLGTSYFLSGQNEEAIQACKKAIDNNPNDLRARRVLTAAYSAAGLMDEAKASALTILKMAPKFTLEKYSKMLRFKNPADKELLISNLRKAGLPEKPPLTLPDKPSIAVLAFDNMSGDPEQEYFSDGITEDIITTLSKIDQLFVIARNSTFTYKGKSVKVKQVAEELGVRYILEGSVRKSEDRVRITAQLIDATAGNHLWAERYDRDLKDIFALQDEITMKIVTALSIKLTDGEQARIRAKQIKNAYIFDKVLQTMSLWNEGSKKSIIRLGQLAQEIVDAEPESSVGYMYLGWYHYGLARRGISHPENVKKAFKFAQKATFIDESDGFSHSLFASVYLLMKEHEKAIASGKRAVELQPNGAWAHLILGSTLGYAGRFDKALVYLKQAIRLNPFPSFYYYYPLGLCYMFKGRLDDALIEFKRYVQRAPNVSLGHMILAINYIYLGRNEEARASAAKALELKPNLSVSYIRKMSHYKNPAHTQYLLDAMRKAGFPE